MKLTHSLHKVLVVFGFTLSLASMLQAQAPKARDEDPEFAEARQLFWSGQYKEAEIKLKNYLGQHPDHAPSKDFLKMIAQSRKYNPAQIGETKNYLNTLRIDKIELKEADWRDACAKFEALANPGKGAKSPPSYLNLINLIPSSFHRKVTLNLKDVTLMQVLEHAAEQAELRLVVDTWAVIFDLPPENKK
jgi:hypothetical protein